MKANSVELLHWRKANIPCAGAGKVSRISGYVCPCGGLGVIKVPARFGGTCYTVTDIASGKWVWAFDEMMDAIKAANELAAKGWSNKASVRVICEKYEVSLV